MRGLLGLSGWDQGERAGKEPTTHGGVGEERAHATQFVNIEVKNQKKGGDRPTGVEIKCNMKVASPVVKETEKRNGVSMSERKA